MVIGERLDLMNLEVFFNLNDSVILDNCLMLRVELIATGFATVFYVRGIKVKNAPLFPRST